MRLAFEPGDFPVERRRRRLGGEPPRLLRRGGALEAALRRVARRLRALQTRLRDLALALELRDAHGEGGALALRLRRRGGARLQRAAQPLVVLRRRVDLRLELEPRRLRVRVGGLELAHLLLQGLAVLLQAGPLARRFAKRARLGELASARRRRDGGGGARRDARARAEPRGTAGGAADDDGVRVRVVGLGIVREPEGARARARGRLERAGGRLHREERLFRRGRNGYGPSRMRVAASDGFLRGEAGG